MEKMDLKSKLHEVSQRIRTMREIMNLTEEEMADKTGVSLEDYKTYVRLLHEYCERAVCEGREG